MLPAWWQRHYQRYAPGLFGLEIRGRLLTLHLQVISVRKNADPLLSVFQPIRAGKLTSVTTDSSILVKSIPHLYKLAQYPVVLHVSVQPAGFPDFSDITSIRQSGFTFIQSETLQESQDLALTAHALAVKSGKGVIHFFDSSATAFKRPISLEDVELARIVLDLDAVDFILRVLMIEKKAASKYTNTQAQSSSSDTDEDVERTEQTPLLPKNPSQTNWHRLTKPKNWLTRTIPILLLFRHPGLCTAIWIGFMQSILLGAFDATIPLVASEQLGFDSLKAGLLFLPLGAADFLLGPVFGWGVDRYGTRLFSVLGFIWLVPTLVLLRLPTEPYIVGHLDIGRLIALFSSMLALNGVGLAIINSPSIVEAGSIVEKSWQANKDIYGQAPWAQLYGINSMVFSAGLTVGPLIAGALRESIGYGNMNAVLAGACGFTAILAFLFIGREEKNLDEPNEVADESLAS